MSRMLREILLTGAWNSDESERIRQAGFEWKPCLWCKVQSYTLLGLCQRCAEDQRTATEPIP